MRPLRDTAQLGNYTDALTLCPMKTKGRRRKNIFIDQERIDRVKELLGTDTETETIDRALAIVEDMEQFKAEVLGGLEKMVGKGGFVDYFSDHEQDE